MKKLLRGMVLGSIVLVSLQMDVFATETIDPTITGTVVTGGIDMNASIMMIKDPYEQCLAYTKYKKITNIDCKKKAEEIKQKKEEQKTEINDEEHNASKRPMPIYDDKGEKKMKNNTNELKIEKNNTPYLDRAKLLDTIYNNALSQSKVELSNEDKSKIIQAFREYLTSAIINGAFDEIKYTKIDEIKKPEKFNKMEEIQEIRQETKKEVKEIRTTQKSDIKSKQEAMRKLLKEKKDAMKNKLPTPVTTN